MSQVRETRVGLAYGIAAFVFWGLNPIYWKWLKAVPAYEILAHRAVWALVFVVLLIVYRHEWRQSVAAVKSRVAFLRGLGTAAFLACNWFIYVYAINTDRILETSLGYYINPLLNVVLGLVFLRERLTRLQLVAVLLAASGVAVMALDFGRLPWISLGLAVTFGFYGLMRKTSPLGAIVGFGLETSLMSVPALLIISFWEWNGVGHFTGHGWRTTGLLMGTGVITAIPLMCFARGVRSIRLSTIGLIQYLTPTCTFFLGILVYGESFTRTHLITFGCIWLALVIYTADGIRRRRQSSYQT